MIEPRPACFMIWRSRPAHQKRRTQIDGQNLVPVLQGGVFKVSDLDNARHIGQHVQSAVLIRDLLDHFGNVFRLRQVRRATDGPQPPRRQGLHLRFEFLGVPINAVNGRAFLGEALRHGPADATRRARHHTNLACQPGDRLVGQRPFSGGTQVATRPPSINRPMPVVNELMSEARYRTVRAISSGVPIRPIGVADIQRASTVD